MRYLEKIETKIKCTEGMSPAEVYQCSINDKTCYLKRINNIYANTTYSVTREAKVMRWLNGRLKCPKVIEYGQDKDMEYLIMSEIKGQHIDDFVKNPMQYLAYITKAVKLLQSVDISDCPFRSNVDMRLQELDFLLKHNLADINTEHWQSSTEFSNPQELYKWLCTHRPYEDYVFSHGDLGANFFVVDDEMYLYDLARCGMADKWLDIAMLVRDIREYFPNSDYEKMFYEMLEIEPDYEKIKYYILLDELF